MPSIQGEIIYAPPPPSPSSGQRAFSRGGGGGYILSPHVAGILYARPFYTPPTPRRVFVGVEGWECIKFGPVFRNSFTTSDKVPCDKIAVTCGLCATQKASGKGLQKQDQRSCKMPSIVNLRAVQPG